MPREGYVYCSCCNSYITARRERAHRAKLNTPYSAAETVSSKSGVKQIVDISSESELEDFSMLSDGDDPEPMVEMNDIRTPLDNYVNIPEALGVDDEDADTELQGEQILHKWYQERRRVWQDQIISEPESEEEEGPGGNSADSDNEDDEAYPEWDSFNEISSWDQLGEGYEQDAAGVGE